MWPNGHTFNEEIPNEKLHFLCSELQEGKNFWKSEERDFTFLSTSCSDYMLLSCHERVSEWIYTL